MAKKKTVKLHTEAELRKKYTSADKATIRIPDGGNIWLPSSNLSLNWQLGGGIPYGKVLEVMGYESTGKSLMALDFARSVQKLGGVVLWGDIEFAWSNHWAKKNGINPADVELLESNILEEFADWSRDMINFYRSKLTANEPILLVGDSIALMETKENIGADAIDHKAQMGNRAKEIGRMYRERMKQWHDLGVCVIMINQVREKVGASIYESNQTSPGGKATRFAASQRVTLIRSKQIKGFVNSKDTWTDSKTKGNKVGQNIICKIEKNKVAAPRHGVTTQVYFSPEIWGYTGYSKYHGLDDILVEDGIINQKGSRFYNQDDDMICNGKEKLIAELHTNKKLRSSCISESSINTISKTRARLEQEEYNLFPVDLKGASENDEE